MVIRLDDPAEPRRVTPLSPIDRRVEELLEPLRPIELPRLMPGDGTARISPTPPLDEPPDENDRRIDGRLPLDEFDERIDDPRLTDDPRLIVADPRRIPEELDEPTLLRDRLIPLVAFDRPVDPGREYDPGRLDLEMPDDRPTLERVPRLMLDRVDGATLDRERPMPERLIPDRPTLDREREIPELERLRLTPRDGDDDLDRLIPLDRDDERDRLTPRERDDDDRDDDDRDRLTPRELDDRERLMPLDRPLDWASPVSVNAKTQTAAIIQTKLVRVVFMSGASKVGPAEK